MVLASNRSADDFSKQLKSANYSTSRVSFVVRSAELVNDKARTVEVGCLQPRLYISLSLLSNLTSNGSPCQLWTEAEATILSTSRRQAPGSATTLTSNMHSSATLALHQDILDFLITCACIFLLFLIFSTPCLCKHDDDVDL